MLSNFLKIYGKSIWIVKNYEKKYLVFVLFLLTLVTSFTELVTLSSFLPLIDILLDTNKYLNNSFFLSIINFFNLEQNEVKNYILFFFGLILIISYLLKILLISLGAYLTHDISYDLNNKIFNKTIKQDYSFFKNSNTSVFLGNLEKAEMVRGTIFSLFQLHISSILFFSVVLFVFYVDFFVTAIFSGIVGSLYLFILFTIKKKINNFSDLNAKLINSRYKFLLENTNNIKEIILRNLNDFFFEKHKKIIGSLKKIRVSLEIYSNVPGQIVILIISLLILLLIYYFSLSEEGLKGSIPLLGLFILAAQRTIPQLQNMFNGLLGLKQSQYSFFDVLEVLELDDGRLEKNKIYEENEIRLNSNIRISKFSYFYKEENGYILRDCDVKFEKNKIYGIYGDSGSGKSTLFDIIMGLLKINEGDVYIDDKKIEIFNNQNWQSNICHIPQMSSLNDESIVKNIAYGYHLNEIDLKKVKNSARLAGILDFIENTNDGFETTIGENGTRLSGGQRQRLSLAKAFYSNKQIILLDESTNALDLQTEEKIYKNLREISKDKIILIISHTKKFENFFDHIYKINDQKIKLIK